MSLLLKMSKEQLAARGLLNADGKFMVRNCAKVVELKPWVTMTFGDIIQESQRPCFYRCLLTKARGMSPPLPLSVVTRADLKDMKAHWKGERAKFAAQKRAEAVAASPSLLGAPKPADLGELPERIPGEPDPVLLDMVEAGALDLDMMAELEGDDDPEEDEWVPSNKEIRAANKSQLEEWLEGKERPITAKDGRSLNRTELQDACLNMFRLRRVR